MVKKLKIRKTTTKENQIMKGRLLKKDDSWYVGYWEPLTWPNETRSILIELPLHSDNTTKMDGQVVEFEIVKNQKMSGAVKYAKLKI